MLCASPGPALPEMASLWKPAPDRRLWTIGGQLLSVVVSRVGVMLIVMAAPSPGGGTEPARGVHWVRTRMRNGA